MILQQHIKPQDGNVCIRRPHILKTFQMNQLYCNLQKRRNACRFWSSCETSFIFIIRLSCVCVCVLPSQHREVGRSRKKVRIHGVFSQPPCQRTLALILCRAGKMGNLVSVAYASQLLALLQRPPKKDVSHICT